MVMHTSKRSFLQTLRYNWLKFVAESRANVRAQEKLAVAVPYEFKRGL